MEYDKVKQILTQNKSKGFVKRILNRDNYKPLDNGDGSYSTHSMAWGEADGKFFVFPTVLMNDKGSLQRFKPNDAWKASQKTGNYIMFDNQNDAAEFSKEYRKVWDSSR